MRNSSYDGSAYLVSIYLCTLDARKARARRAISHLVRCRLRPSRTCVSTEESPSKADDFAGLNLTMTRKHKLTRFIKV